MSLQRDMGAPGVRFDRQDGQIVWTRVIDASSSQGPRTATEADVKAWPSEFQQFVSRDRETLGDDVAEIEAAPTTPPPPKRRGPNKPKPKAE